MKQLTAREIALRILVIVEKEKAYANIVLHHHIEKHRLQKLDRAFITELVYGVLRTLKTLDYIINLFLKHPLHKQTVWIRNILRIGVYQFYYMDKTPVGAACSEAVNLAKVYGPPGSAGFVNGVLRSVIRHGGEVTFPDIDQHTVAHLAVKYSHPEWLVKKWLGQLGLETTQKLCKANNQIPPNTIRTNTLKVNREELNRSLSDAGLKAVETSYADEGLHIDGFQSIGSLSAFKDGLFQVQDESSMLAAKIVSPHKGAKILDVCAAPGGKTTHLAQLMENTGAIKALDIYPHKLRLIAENCSRLGISNVELLLFNALDLPGPFKEWAEYVLVDAPCSGLGVLRRRPDLRWHKKPGQIKQLIRLQKTILRNAASCLKAGGVMVYCTCTINHCENTAVVQDFLGKHPDFYEADISTLLPPNLQSSRQSVGSLTIYPHQHNMDGFFMARLRKRGRLENAVSFSTRGQSLST